MKRTLREVIEKGASIEELDEAVILVQDELGVTSGDVADVFFNGDPAIDQKSAWKLSDPDRRMVLLIDYTRAELPFLLTYESRKKA